MTKSFDHREWECCCCCTIVPRMPQFRSATKHDHFDGLLIFFLSYFIIICGWSLWHISEEYFSILILNWLSVQLSHTIRRLHKTFYGERWLSLKPTQTMFIKCNIAFCFCLTFQYDTSNSTSEIKTDMRCRVLEIWYLFNSLQ